MGRSATVLAIAASAALLAGCVETLTESQKSELALYEAKKIAVHTKNPSSGAFLGLLPGGGSFYTRNYGLGVLNLLTWPFSMFWDPMNGYEGSLLLNYYASQAGVNEMRQTDMRQVTQDLQLNLITPEQFNIRKGEISEKYSGRY